MYHQFHVPKHMVAQGHAPYMLQPLGFSYTQTDPLALQVIADQFRLIVVSPGNFDTSPTGNAVAYVPLTGLHAQNASQAPWLSRIEEIDGFVRDDDGKKIEDVTGPGTYLIDVRRPEVRAILHDYVASLRAQGYRHFFYDAIDSFGYQETAHPHGPYRGLMAAAVNFVLAEQEQNTGVTIVNGGMYVVDGRNPLALWAEHGIELALESQFIDGNGTKLTPNHHEYTRGKLHVYALHAKKGFAPTVHFLQPHLDPDAAGYEELNALVTTNVLSNRWAALVRYSIYIPPVDYGTLWAPAFVMPPKRSNAE